MKTIIKIFILNIYLIFQVHCLILMLGCNRVFGQAISDSKSGDNVNQKGVHEDLAIGKTYQGGIIFKLEENEKHGLIAGSKIINTGITRDNNKEIKIFARVDGINAGKDNSRILLAVRSGDKTEDYAKLSAGNYLLFDGINVSHIKFINGNSLDDWYLPSRYELKLLYQNLQKNEVPGFTSIQFLNSTDISNKDPWEMQEFDDANPKIYDNDTIYVLPIKSF